MRFSIVVPNYNSGEVLERAIRSITSQDYPDVQIILADAESSDGSRELIEKYRDIFDPLICRRDKGQADGLNNGFTHANGDIFAWLCADDELLPGALEHIAGLFQSHPAADVITGCCERVYVDGSVYISPADAAAWSTIGIKDTIEQPSTFWRASLHRRLGDLDTSYHLAFDWDFWCRMREAGANLLTTDRVLSRYYFSQTNKSGISGKRHVTEGFRIVRKYGPLGGGLAYIYRFLYKHFDLHGCYDRPPTCTKIRGALFVLTMKALKTLISERLLYMYNWHFASCQERNMKWW